MKNTVIKEQEVSLLIPYTSLFLFNFFAGLGFITRFFLRKTQDRSLQPQAVPVARLPLQ